MDEVGLCTKLWNLAEPLSILLPGNINNTAWRVERLKGCCPNLQTAGTAGISHKDENS